MEIVVSDDKEKMNIQEIADLLHKTYWAGNRSKEVIACSLEHSLAFVANESASGKVIGFARVITDYATNYYLCDVVVDESLRGQGIGTELINHIVNDERISGLRGILMTGDAHGFYEKFGFQKEPMRAMSRK